MIKRTLVSFLLSGLLIACASATPTSRPTTTLSSGSSAIPTQISTLPPSLTPTQTPAPSAEAAPTNVPEYDPGLERIAHLGGGIFGITVAGDLAYVGMGLRVAVIDISQHQHPQLIGQSEPLPGLVSQLIQISGRLAPLLVVNAGKYLVLINTSNPHELKPVQQLALAEAVTAMVWDDRESILYVGNTIHQSLAKHSGLISAFGLTPDDRLEFIKSVSMPEWPLSLALGETGLFAGAEGTLGGLYYTQVRTPGELSTPHQVVASTPVTPLQPTSMQVIGNRLYLSYKSMEAYDITNPDQPVQAWANLSGHVVGKSFSLAGDQIYLFGWNIFSEYLCEAIRLQEPVAGTPRGVTASDTAMHNGDFLVAYQDLQIYAPADPENLQLVGSLQAAVSNAVGAVANDAAVFVVDNRTGDGSSNAILRVLSLPDLKPLGQIATEFSTAWADGYRGIAMDGNQLYLGTDDSVWVYDVSKSEPGLLGKAEIEGGQLEAIAAAQLGEQRLLLIAQMAPGTSSVLTLYDMTDPQNPTRLGNPLDIGQGHTLQIIWNGSAVYVLLDTTYFSDRDLLYAIDYKNGALTLRESLQLPEYANSMAVAGDVVVVTGTDSLSVISIDASGSLKHLVQKTLPEPGYGAAVVKDKVLVVVGDSPGYEFGAGRLLVLDIQNPGHLRQVGAVDIAISLNDTVPILLSGPYVILVNGSGGLEVLDYATPS